jgi:hypothetical protein
MVLSFFDIISHPNQVQAFHILPLRHKKSSIKSNSFWKSNRKGGKSIDIKHDNNNNKKKNFFIKHSTSKRTTFKTAMASLAIYSTVLLRTPHVANANHPLENAPTGRISLKPGATIESIQQELELRNEMTIEELARSSAASGGVSGTTSTTGTSSNKGPLKKSLSQKNSKEEDDEYDIFEEDEDDIMESSTFTNDRSNIHSSSSSSSAMDLSNSNVAKTVTKFSGSAPTMSSKTKNQQVAKTVVKIMGPIFGFCFARETIRWNREQNNVDKGIEIMEQQRREYLNMKQEEEEDDDEDSDDDEDDDEDSDEDSDSDEEE